MELSGRRSLPDQATPSRIISLLSSYLSFLSETKNSISFLQDFQVEIGYDILFTVDPVGWSGGLALFYMNDSEVDILFSNNCMIDIEAQMERHEVFITFMYGDPVIEYRENVWERLTRISLRRTRVWLLMGDFNEIISNAEKKGGKRD